MNPLAAGQENKPLILDGRSLCIEDLVSVARFRRRVAIHPKAAERVRRCRILVDKLVDWNEKVYGLTTGFGKLRDVVIPADKVELLQKNIIQSHACGVGAPFSEDVVRAAILLRANTLCLGRSGIRLETLQQLLNLINDDIYPFVPKKGSVGASGDLAPLSHLALVLTGDPFGRYYSADSRRDKAVILQEPREEDFDFLPKNSSDLADLARRQGWTFRPVTLKAKEGLALTNGTQFMTAIAGLAVYDMELGLRFSTAAMAMSLESLRGVREAFDPRVHHAREHEGQVEIAEQILRYGDDSHILSVYLNTARLGRAGTHLREAAEMLQDARRELEKEGRSSPEAARAVLKGLMSCASPLAELVPTSADGRMDAKTLGQWQALSPREQIDGFEALLAPKRREVMAILRLTEDTSFFQIPASAMIRGFIVAALGQLQKASPESPLVQDDYSFRCHPQVAACAKRALAHARKTVEIEINSATDNPLLFCPGEEDENPPEPATYKDWLEGGPEMRQRARESVVSGGNFHGQPIATVMDYLCIAAAEIGNIAERRIAQLLSEDFSRGLPPFLIEPSGLNSGFMVLQYTAAALVSENKLLCHPAGVDSIPTSAGAEDHVSMGTIAARKAAELIGNVRTIIAIEILTAYQALKFRRPFLPGKSIRRILQTLEECGVLRYEADRVMYPDIRRVTELMSDPRLIACLLPDEDSSSTTLP